MLLKDAPCRLEQLYPWRLCPKNFPCSANDELNLFLDDSENKLDEDVLFLYPKKKKLTVKQSFVEP
jgi:hypothetical protein